MTTNTFKRLFIRTKEKITGEDKIRAQFRALADSEIDLMPPDMAKEYAEWLHRKRQKDGY